MFLDGVSGPRHATRATQVQNICVTAQSARSAGGVEQVDNHQLTASRTVASTFR